MSQATASILVLRLAQAPPEAFVRLIAAAFAHPEDVTILQVDHQGHIPGLRAEVIFVNGDVPRCGQWHVCEAPRSVFTMFLTVSNPGG